MYSASCAGKRCPDDVSVVGFDDYFSGILIPPLTTVRHRLYDMGYRAAQLLLELIAEPECLEQDPILETLIPELVIGECTGTGTGA